MIESVGQKIQIDGQIRRTNHGEFVPSLRDRTIAAVHSGRKVKIDEQKPRDPSTPIKFALAMSSRAFGDRVHQTLPNLVWSEKHGCCGARLAVVT